MDVDVMYRRKRPIQEAEYREKKRFLSEQFFNMRISQSQEGADRSASKADDEEYMEDDLPKTPSELASMNRASSISLSHTDDNDSDLEDLDDDTPAPRLSRLERQSGSNDLCELSDISEDSLSLPGPFQRKSTSTADERVDEWVRTSRHRLLAEASVDSAPDLCRALIVYKPLPLAGSADSEGNENGEAGGDPTPSPFSGSVDGEKSQANERSRCESSSSRSGKDVSALGSMNGTLKAMAFSGGECNSGHVLGSRGTQTGRGMAHSADDGAGGIADIEGNQDSMMEVDPMDTSAPADYDDGLGPWQGTPGHPTLTRQGMSRGAPTPNLSPEWVALARKASTSTGRIQEVGEVTGVSRPGNVPTGPWGW